MIHAGNEHNGAILNRPLKKVATDMDPEKSLVCTGTYGIWLLAKGVNQPDPTVEQAVHVGTP